eukprot:tig00001098_g7066.t1
MPRGDEAPGKAKPRKGVHAPTIEELNADPLTQIASESWVGANAKKPFDKKVVERIYKDEDLVSMPVTRKMLLEFSTYLESYLWPHYDPKASSVAHTMSILVMVNEKFRENVPVWGAFHKRDGVFSAFFNRALGLRDEHKEMSLAERTAYIVFFINCFQSLEDEMVRKECLKLVSLPIWNTLSPGKLEKELSAYPQLQKHWKVLKQKEAKNPPTGPRHEVNFLPSMLKEFLATLSGVTGDQTPSRETVLFLERSLELLVDLMGQLPTRRFFRAVLEDHHIVLKARMHPLRTMPEGRLYAQLLDMLAFYQGFEINDHTGSFLTEDELVAIHTTRLSTLQNIAYKYFLGDLKELAMTSIGRFEQREALLRHLGLLTDEKLFELCWRLKLLPQAEKPTESRELMLELLVLTHEKRRLQLEQMNAIPLYPTEEVLFDENLVPTGSYTGETCLALPKLNLQFLTFHDYLLRNFNLFRLESTYEIREDVEDVVRRLNPKRTFKGETVFEGWARMAIPIKKVDMNDIGKPRLGETKPSRVRGEVHFNVRNAKPHVRREWDTLKQHDVIFLLTIRASNPVGSGPEDVPTWLPFPQQYGLVYVRGAEIEAVLDSKNVRIDEHKDQHEHEAIGDWRRLKVSFDASQYEADQLLMKRTGEDPYKTFNIVLRRNPKENNFKAVLETIRDLCNAPFVVPEWLHDVFLGYGDPAAAAYYNMPNPVKTFDFQDTFVSPEHLVSCFPDQKVKFSTEDKALLRPPFRVTFPDKEAKDQPIVAEPYLPPDPGPYPQDIPRQNKVPFTPVQLEAIKSGMSHGLTMVVGPPGTGKTDVAVQIISNIYHNFPDQRTLIVTHSNNALNDLFEKIMERDVNEIHLLRLGAGEEELATDKDFSRAGRVNYMLARRLEFLDEVGRLARSLELSDDAAYTCETAQHFYLFHVVARWELFQLKLARLPDAERTPAKLQELFPFTRFFRTAPQPLFKGQSYEGDLRTADGCMKHIRKIFEELEMCRPFELLRNMRDRGNYLISKQAKIIAMTCTHAALKRRDFVNMGFKYDNVLMEESAQIMEIETFIPLLLQNQQDGQCRLKRVVLIGDHHQLPPVIKNLAFAKYSHLDQSLFSRFVRLGVPTVNLNLQGRARPSIADLYSWRYKFLGNLPNVHSDSQYRLANAGFAHDFQLIDVGPLNGVGESDPTPFFYQNLAEAEYIVAVYQYMRLLGYPASRISILTTYNGQKHLLKDVIAQRCAWNPFFGQPACISTVDKYQGQQNDYVLLSLVRTRAIGHIRDVRRLVVALSRARLGLYIFCRKSLFEQSYELAPALSQMLARPTKLQLVPSERFPATREISTKPAPDAVQEVADVHEMSVLVYNKSVQTFQEAQSMQAEFGKQLAEIRKQQAAEEAGTSALIAEEIARVSTAAIPKPISAEARDEDGGAEPAAAPMETEEEEKKEEETAAEEPAPAEAPAPAPAEAPSEAAAAEEEEEEAPAKGKRGRKAAATSGGGRGKKRAAPAAEEEAPAEEAAAPAPAPAKKGRGKAKK